MPPDRVENVVQLNVDSGEGQETRQEHLRDRVTEAGGVLGDLCLEGGREGGRKSERMKMS